MKQFVNEIKYLCILKNITIWGSNEHIPSFIIYRIRYAIILLKVTYNIFLNKPVNLVDY